MGRKAVLIAIVQQRELTVFVQIVCFIKDNKMQRSSYCGSKASLEVQISCDTTKNDTTKGISNTNFI